MTAAIDPYANFPSGPTAGLQLEQALQLLAQSGREPPAGVPGSAQWVHG